MPWYNLKKGFKFRNTYSKYTELLERATRYYICGKTTLSSSVTAYEEGQFGPTILMNNETNRLYIFPLSAIDNQY